MKQFILNCKPNSKNLVTLDGDDYKYLVRVRRLAVGEQFSALLPDGTETLVQITSIDKNKLTGKIGDISCRHKDTDSKEIKMVLFQALPKGGKMDLIVRQAAEGGITEIVPFVSEFSMAKKSAGDVKISRWERIIKEARQQSGSKTATVIQQPLSLKELFEYWKNLKGAAGLLFHHQGVEQNSLHEYLNNIDTAQSVVLAIGPEGGFSDAETALFVENGFKPFTIGNTILRTETAALYCAAAVKIILLEKDKWQLNLN
jgi:16S rRNA (uracil1498-N3)-methyltransferase